MFIHDFLKDKLKLQNYQKLGIIFLLVVISGFFGWVYEFIFYFFNGGMQEWYMQGGNFLPWINIYAIGGLLILFTTYKFKKHPLAVFFIAFFATGILELIAGWLVYTIGNGTRYWDYNTEILNFGNIGGFVCLRSVLFFGISALFLMCLFITKAQQKSLPYPCHHPIFHLNGRRALQPHRQNLSSLFSNGFLPLHRPTLYEFLGI